MLTEKMMDEFEEKHQQERKERKVRKKIIIIAIITFIIAFSIPFLLSCIAVVPAGTTGVQVRFGAVQDTTLSSGAHLIKPLTKIIKVNNKIVRTDVDGESASKDLQTIQTTVSVNYQIVSNKSAEIYKTIGEDVENTIVRPAVQECVKAAISQYTAEELITKRQSVSDNINQLLADNVGQYGININKVNILNLNFSAEFNAAIEAKQTAQQQALKAEQDLARIKIEAEQEVAKAQADAQAYKLKNAEITESDRLLVLQACHYNPEGSYLLVIAKEKV